MLFRSEKQLVAESLRVGAWDFLDKPIDPKALITSLELACGSTRHERQLARVESDVKEVGRIQQQMVASSLSTSELALDLFYQPSHEAGGDYISLFPVGARRYLVLATDVSGHDLKAAYISAYFQGFVRGMMERSASMDEILNSFNRYLIDEWNKASEGSGQNKGVTTSIAVCAIGVDLDAGVSSVLSCGFPLQIGRAHV